MNGLKKLRKKPFIGLLGLNPHNGEMRSNSEEKNYSSMYRKTSK